MIMDIYGIGVIIAGIAGIIFTLKNDKDKMYISLIILFFIILLKYLIGN
jgi:hypothetical protein